MVVPITAKRPRKVNLKLLTFNLGLAILTLIASYYLKAGK